MAQLNNGNETSFTQKAKNDKRKIAHYLSTQNEGASLDDIADWVRSKYKPDKFYMTVFIDGKVHVDRVYSDTFDNMELKKPKYIERFSKKLVTFSKIKAL